MATEVLTDEEQVRALVPQWRSLAAARGNAFLTPDWYFAWLAVYGAQARPWIPVIRDGDGTLAALVPLAAHGERASLAFAGANLGDMFGPLGRASEDDNRVMEALGRALRERRDWSALLLENVPAETSWVSRLEGKSLGVMELPHRDEVLPWIPLRGRTWEEYLASRSRNFRSQLGRKRRGLEQEGALAFRRCEDPETLPHDLSAFFALHHSRWDDRGGSQALTERSREFHRTFAAAAQEHGWLRLWLAELDGEPIAAWYGWLIGGRYAYYLAGFDERWSRFSIGQTMLAHTIQEAFAERAEVYDLLLGDEGYKARFAEDSNFVRTVAITRPWSAAGAKLRAENVARRATNSLSPERREALKKPLRALTKRLPSRVER